MGFSMDIQKINMWRIQVTTRTIVRVCCERCIKVGKVVKDCPMCGGTGVHNKHVVRYEVNPKPVEVNKIDRDDNGRLRYWTGYDSFYYESANHDDNYNIPAEVGNIHLLSFTQEDAIKERNRINKCLEDKSL